MAPSFETIAEGLGFPEGPVAMADGSLLFVDIQLPDCDGLDLAKEVRARSDAGIIFVTRRDSEIDRILGLELAGDHYVTKPVNLRDLLARARSLLRRKAIDREAARQRAIVSFGCWMLDLVRRELMISDGTPVPLTRAEFDLLAAIVDADGRPLTRDYLIEVISTGAATSMCAPSMRSSSDCGASWWAQASSL